MSERWIDTDTESTTRKSDFWESMKTDLDAGKFWADKIKKYKAEPLKRLNMALDNLPLPGAFKEGAVALRTLIREKRKNKEVYEEELTFLYWLAAIQSFMLAYAPKLKG